MTPITDFLERKLWALNKTHAGIARPTNESHIANVRNAIQSHNDALDIVSVEIDGIPVSKEELQKYKMEIPDALKEKKVAYTATAHHHFANGRLAAKTEFGIIVSD